MTAKTSRGSSAPKLEAPAGITIVSNQLRSTNLERDGRAGEPLGPIYIGVRAQDMLDRVTAALEDRSRTRAWALTGPYGTGKSTLALLVAALLGRDSARRTDADQRLAEASATLAQRFAEARESIAPHGMVAAIATARREPLFDTLARAVRNGAANAWPQRPPKPVTTALKALDRPGAGSAEILAAFRALCAESATLVVIDEFGKTLEHLATHGEFPDAHADVFLLQELAEAGAGVQGLPLHILTLQHLSFADYASRTTALQSREWAKVQGRFEDITMTTHLGDAVHLIQQTLDQTGLKPHGQNLVRVSAAAAANAWTARGLDGVLPADAELFAAVYPLHPLTVAVAPLLAGQIGQHDRSLAGFIANDEPHTVRRFLDRYGKARPGRASTVRLADVYDYFLSSGRTTVLASANSSRWIEIDTRISEANGLPEHEQEVLKTIGLLNLVDSSGALRASLDTVLFALTEPTDTTDPDARQQLREHIHGLVDRGFLVHRQFSDEYRVWQGSDVDLGEEIETLIERCDDHTAVEAINQFLPAAVVAGKHSQRTGMLRHFITTATDAETPDCLGSQIGDPADGVLIFHFGDETNLPTVRSSLPAVVGVSGESKNVLAAARYLHALGELNHNSDLDAVARRELAERIVQANAELATRLAAAFAPNQFAAKWYLLRPTSSGYAKRQDGEPPLQARSLAGVVSAACDEVYPHTPEIRNEMLGRHQLTSQGAKARRELMTAMLAHRTEQNLDIDGYGPDRAMYGGVLKYLRLHQPAKTAEALDGSLIQFAYTPPQDDSPLAPAWAALWQNVTTDKPVRVDEIFALLTAPPYGIKAGVVPVIVLTALIIGEQDLAVFENGTYQPRLTDAFVERMVKSPEAFTVKAVSVQSGPRKAAIAAIADVLQIGVPDRPRPGMRNATVLAVTRDLLDRVRVLTPYALRTNEISAAAAGVRTALTQESQPDTLLFDALPTALGMRSIPGRGKVDKQAAADYANALNAALHEIAGIDRHLVRRVAATIGDAFRLPHDLSSLRHDLAAHTRSLLDATLIEPRLRGLITVTHDNSVDDDQWLDMAIVRIAGRGATDWRDTDAVAFAQQAKAIAKTLERVSHLYQAARPEEGTEPFSAHLLTLTRSDGREEHALVHIPDSVESAAEGLANAVLAEARQVLGVPNGERILLAMLAQRLVGDADSNAAATEPAPRSTTRRKATS